MAARILVVDDDPLICEQLASLYSGAGYAARATSEPGEAIEILAREGYDLGVIDLKMPTTDGITLMQEMRARAPALDFIMITGHASIKGAVEAIRMGGSGRLHHQAVRPRRDPARDAEGARAPAPAR
jgi:DNA-binding NtrC family response regulator